MTSSPLHRLTLAAAVLILIACDMRPPSAVTLAIVNARVWTGVAARPWADAIAISDSIISVVGSSAEVRKLAGSARVIDADGQLIVPGFVDAHVHFLMGGMGLTSVKLRDARTPEEFVARIRDFARTIPAGAWILAGDWDHTTWGGQLPGRSWIDSVTPDNPVWVNRLDGHMNLANGAALRAAGVNRSTAEVPGGEIVRDAAGEPTGILKDNAMTLVSRVIPAAPSGIEDRALDSAMNWVASHGVTSVHHMGSWEDIAVFRRARAAGRLRTRIYAAVPLGTWEQLRDTVAAEGTGDEWLRIGGLKGFVDGSLGSHTALMFDGFTDAPGDRGLFVTPPESLYKWTAGADKAGLHVMVHAIGDRAIATQLDIFARVASENGPRDRRFRIEHAQHIGPSDMGRFAALGVIASMQPYHAIDDGRWADSVIGPDRSSRTYAFRSLIDSGATLAFGSDWFVAPPVPLEAIYAAVTRRTIDDRNPGGWVPAQKIMVEEALRAHTRGSAYASGDESNRGRIAPGMFADLVMIDRDITTIAPESIREATVTLTVVGGKIVHERPVVSGRN
ncbi:MAG: amidohydrolase [Gemmatimonadota bacterium]